MIERSFTPDELRELQARAEHLGSEHIREVEAEWPHGYASDPALLRRTGLDPEIFAYVNKAIRAL
ncbi:MAG TPA: hypothetical protein VII52_09675 [Gemmatimonadaceae bacterium]